MNSTAHLLLGIIGLAALHTCCLAQEAGVVSHVTKSVAEDPTSLHLRGVIRPYRRIVLRSPIDSKVLQIAGETGQNVTAQTVLIQLDTRALERQLHFAEMQLEKVRAQLAACELGLKQIDASTERLRDGKEEAMVRLEFASKPQPPLGFAGRVVDSESHIMRSPLREEMLDEFQETIDKVEASQVRIRAKRARLLSFRQELSRAEHGAVAAIQITQQRMGEAVVTAEAEGVIARYLVQPSQAVSAGDELVEVIQTDRLKATLWLPDKLASSFDPRDRPWYARVRSSNGEAPWHAAVVRDAMPLPHPRTEQTVFDVEVDNTKGNLRAGMWVDAILETSNVAQTPSRKSVQ